MNIPLTHCTPSPRRALATVLAVAVALALAGLTASARADGDPASDVLATQTLFLAADANIPVAQRAQIAGLLAEAGRARYRLRVAIIASPTDLGSVTALWGQPQSYASFLAQELGLVYPGALLVVMPNGYGTASGALAGAPGRALGTGALAAIERLATAAGHPLAPPATNPPHTSGATTDAVPWLVFAAGCVLLLCAWGASFRVRPPALR